MEGEDEMREWLKKNDVLFKVLALLIAVILWLFVLNADNPERTIEKRDVPVLLLGEDVLETKYGLTLVDDVLPTVDLQFRGALKRLGEMTDDSITVRADLSQISKPGTYQISYDVSVMDGITTVSRDPIQISVTVDEILELDLPVQIHVVGELPKNLQVTETLSQQPTVRVQGAKSQLENACYAVVQIQGSSLNESFYGDAEYTITDESGKTIEGSTIEKIDPTVPVEITVAMQKEVELAIDIIPADGVSSSDAKVTIDPERLTIVGDIETVNSLEWIVIGTVDLGTFLQNYTSEMPIELPDTVRSVDSITEAKVTVSLTNIETLLIPVDTIELMNKPDDYDAVVETLSVVVTLRGSKEALAQVDADDISLVVDMKNEIPKEGRALYPAVVTFAQEVGDVGVYGTYNVIINAAQKTVDVELESLPG